MIDNTAADDTGAGTPSDPWKTSAPFNSGAFSPGDFIAWTRGQTHLGTVNPPSAGTSGSRIKLGTTGTGALPILDATGKTFGLTLAKDWLELVDLDVRNANNDGARITAANGLMTNMIFRDNGKTVGSTGVRFHNVNANNWTITGGRSTGNSHHGYSFEDGAHTNTLDGVESDNNGEDGVQYELASGDNNNIIGDYNFRDNVENCLDYKSGTHTVTAGSGAAVLTSDQAPILVQRNTVQVTFNGVQMRSTGAARLMNALNQQVACVINTNECRFFGGKTGDQSLKLGTGVTGGSLVYNSKSDIFDDEGVAVTAMLAIREAQTGTVLNGTVNRQASGDGIVAPNGGTLTVKNTGMSTTGGQNIDTGGGATLVVDNNAYHRQDGSSNDVVDDDGTGHAETAVVSGLDADGQVGAPNLASLDDTNTDYMRPNTGSPYENNGDGAISGSPTNDNNGEAFESPRNIGAVKGTA